MTSPVAVSFLTSKRRPVSLVFPPAPSMLWSSVWPYTLKVLNSWIPGAVPVISSCNDQVKEGRPLSDWSKPWTWWWPSDSQPGVRWRTCPQQSCQWCPPCTWSCSQWRGSGRSWRCRSDSGLGRGWWWRPPSTRTRPALSGRPRSWWDIWRSAPPGGSCPGSWSWPLVPAQGPPWGRARAPLAVRSTGCRNGGGRLRQPPRELGVATWEGKSLGWGILGAQAVVLTCLILSTVLWRLESWGGQSGQVNSVLTPGWPASHSMWVSVVTNNARLLLILYHPYPALPTVARWTVLTRQMLFCSNHIVTSTITSLQNKLESHQKCPFRQKWIFQWIIHKYVYFIWHLRSINNERLDQNIALSV